MTRVDLVLEGGGVKGVALAGAVAELWRTGHVPARVAGTSAGAVVGAVVAALARSGGSPEDVVAITRTLDYRRFRDRGLAGRLLGPLGVLADGVGLLLEDGAYEGDYLHDWVAGVLRDLGVRTFGDLRTDDPGADGALHHRWRLVVTASDVSRKRLARLPWDYADYGLDPDEQPVAEAVRASASIPFFFEPVTLRGPRGEATLVDGGLVANYPIDLFDRVDGRPGRWPTLGVRIDDLGGAAPAGDVAPVRGPLPLAAALVETAIEGCQAAHVLEPCNVRRSIVVDTSGVGALDFDLTEPEREGLLAAGGTAARDFLDTWDYAAWRVDCRPGEPAAAATAQ